MLRLRVGEARLIIRGTVNTRPGEQGSHGHRGDSIRTAPYVIHFLRQCAADIYRLTRDVPVSCNDKFTQLTDPAVCPRPGITSRPAAAGTPGHTLLYLLQGTQATALRRASVQSFGQRHDFITVTIWPCTGSTYVRRGVQVDLPPERSAVEYGLHISLCAHKPGDSLGRV
jgi:hypothetical protein